MWINALTFRDACANDPDQNHNLFASPGHISWACEIHASNFTSQILFLSFFFFFFKEASLIYFIYSWNGIFSCPTVPQLVSVTSVSMHLFKALNALSCSENDLSLSFVNGFEGLDRTQHLLLAQLWVEASSGRASLSRLAAQAANLFQPSPLAGGDSDARFIITPSLYHPLASSITPRAPFFSPVVLPGLFPALCRCPWARGAGGCGCPPASRGQPLAPCGVPLSQPSPSQAAPSLEKPRLERQTVSASGRRDNQSSPVITDKRMPIQGFSRLSVLRCKRNTLVGDSTFYGANAAPRKIKMQTTMCSVTIAVTIFPRKVVPVKTHLMEGFYEWAIIHQNVPIQCFWHSHTS